MLSDKKEVVIIGAGFAGLTLAQRIFKYKKILEVTVIDKKENMEFLPLLPDCIGREINPDNLATNIKALSKLLNFKFINESVIELNIKNNLIVTTNNVIKYDYLIVASGSEPNFYGNNELKKLVYTINNIKDIKTIKEKLKENFKNVVIIGAGYTGIEIATNIKIYLNKYNKEAKVILIEKGDTILPALPTWIKKYVEKKLKDMDILIYTNSQIKRLDKNLIEINPSHLFDNALIIWSAGVKTASFIDNLNLEKNNQGRIKVNRFLQINNNSFAIGDAALFIHKDVSLRMAVQFAISQANCVAYNIISLIKNKKLKKFIPHDLGYIIPMANNFSCGIILGVKVKGIIPTIMHFIMCIYRTNGIKNKICIIQSLFKKYA
ncbi:MAG: FAD-dependent oxidoreductase [Candidatus Omnitrophica bacterium]|nr:FAD-dependent oxidoreductase [Candidatus Omnitrophota bacterium]